MKRALLIALGLAALAAPAAAIEIRERPREIPLCIVHDADREDHALAWTLGLGFSREENSERANGVPLKGLVALQGGARVSVAPGLALGVNAAFYGLGERRSEFGPFNERNLYAEVPVTGEIVLGAPSGAFRPYVTAGAGTYFFEHSTYLRDLSDAYDHRFTSHFGYNVGAGFEIRSGHEGMGVEAKWHYVQREMGEDARLFTVAGVMHFH